MLLHTQVTHWKQKNTRDICSLCARKSFSTYGQAIGRVVNGRNLGEVDLNNNCIAPSEPRLSILSKAIRISLMGLALVHGSAQAATIEVTSTSDLGVDNDGLCTLREAITSLNNGVANLTGCDFTGEAPGTNDSITLSASLNPASSEITLSGTPLSVQGSNIKVAGSGITINANNESRVFTVTNASLALDSITVTAGLDNSGGGILAQSSAIITLTNCVVSGNSAIGQGGGIVLFTSSSVSLTDCVVSNNSASSNGGGIYTRLGTGIGVTNSSVSGNGSPIEPSLTNLPKGLQLATGEVSVRP